MWLPPDRCSYVVAKLTRAPAACAKQCKGWSADHAKETDSAADRLCEPPQSDHAVAARINMARDPDRPPSHNIKNFSSLDHGRCSNQILHPTAGRRLTEMPDVKARQLMRRGLTTARARKPRIALAPLVDAAADLSRSVSSKCRAVVEQLSSKCRAICVQMSCYCRAIARQLLDICSTTARQLLDNCSTTARQLLDNCSTRARHMHDT